MNCDVQNTIVATKGSIGTVLDYKEYHDYYVNKPFSDDHYLSLVRKWIDDCEQYPIRFDKVVPLSEDFLASWRSQGSLFVECEVGKIRILSVIFLEKIT